MERCKALANEWERLKAGFEQEKQAINEDRRETNEALVELGERYREQINALAQEDAFDWDDEDWDIDENEGFENPPATDKTESDTDLLFTALETLGRGEDPLTQGIEQTTENLVRISYQHFPQGTEQVLNALSHIDSAMDAVVEFIDDSTGNRGSAVWQQLDEPTQARILGAGKVLSVLVPVAKVKGLAELARVPSPALKKDGWHPVSVEARHKEWQEHYGGREDHEYQGISGYVPAPENLRAFPEATLSDRKTPVQGGGELRKRWKDKKGNIYEWDSRHGRIEKYDKWGHHLGEFDPESSQQLSKPNRSRRVEP
ncbi:MAG: colicin E3/pyocin S6 family cytotoxin [Endozoicomonas sp.]|uniref:colicin E3/pyocin S6 family cytotoxin n=1 Tax=Endozoicomonas sp. TaxID=1892382 RepID=UPI003D9B51F7